MNLYFFKIPKYSRFEYIPRYYDPEKERKEELNNRIKFGRESIVKQRGSQISGKFRTNHAAGRRAEKAGSIRKLFLFILLSVVLWYFITEYYDVFMEKLKIISGSTTSSINSK